MKRRVATQASAPDAPNHLGHQGKKKGIGHFFAIDRRPEALACRLGMNAAIAYLVLARGTGRSNLTTGWSVHAICSYTSISRSKARRAISQLISAGLVVKTRGGSRPRYRIVPWPACVRDEYEKHILEAVTARRPLMKKWEHEVAGRLVRLGLLLQSVDGHLQTAGSYEEREWIWLPNEIVTGAAAETPPIERIRQTQDPMALRLFVDLYHAQNLREDGGISRTQYHVKYTREQVGEQAQYTIWGFRQKESYVVWTALTDCHRRLNLTEDEKAAGKNRAIDFFRRMNCLISLGLVEVIPYLIEGDTNEAELIHPCGTHETDSIEDKLGTAAARAAAALLPEWERRGAKEKELLLVPVPRHIENVQMIGVARLRYRPHTRLTSAWWGDMQKKATGYLRKYADSLVIRVTPGRANVRDVSRPDQEPTRSRSRSTTPQRGQQGQFKVDFNARSTTNQKKRSTRSKLGPSRNGLAGGFAPCYPLSQTRGLRPLHP